MSQQDFSQRIVLVIRKDLEPWQIVNTIAHISAYLGNQLKDNFGTGETFATQDDIHHPRNSQYPIVIKRARSNDQLTNLMAKVRGSDLLYHGFIREMIECTDDEELQNKLSQNDDANVEYLGIGIFGPNEEVNQMTKKFGLWE